MNSLPHHTKPSFDDAYAKAPFSELIRLSLVLAAGVVELRKRLARAPARPEGRKSQGRLVVEPRAPY